MQANKQRKETAANYYIGPAELTLFVRDSKNLSLKISEKHKNIKSKRFILFPPRFLGKQTNALEKNKAKK